MSSLSTLENRGIQNLEQLHEQVFGEYSHNAAKHDDAESAEPFTIFTLYRPSKYVYSANTEQ